MTPSTSAPDSQVADSLPHVFVDRSLGATQLPRLLRAAGVQLTTMREHYGEQLGQMTADPDWITLVAERGWIGFHKDAAIRRNDIERAAVRRSGARLFCVPRADITADELARRYLDNLRAIARAAQESGPYVYGVYPHEIKLLPLSLALGGVMRRPIHAGPHTKRFEPKKIGPVAPRATDHADWAVVRSPLHRPRASRTRVAFQRR